MGINRLGKSLHKHGRRLTLAGEKITISVGGKTYSAHIFAVHAISSKPGIFWSEVRYTTKEATPIKLDGIRNSDAVEMLSIFRISLSKYESAAAKKQRLQKFDEFLPQS